MSRAGRRSWSNRSAAVASGRRRVDVGELPRFAAALGVTIRQLLGQAERAASAMAARLAADVAPGATAAARRRARRLLELDDLLPTSRSAARRRGLELAELTRRELDLGSDALGDLAAVIETRVAVDVALSPSGTEVDGLRVHAGGGALIVASTDHSVGRLRFTRAHELGHHPLGDPGSGATGRAVVGLMEHFGTSRRAMIRRIDRAPERLARQATGAAEVIGEHSAERPAVASDHASAVVANVAMWRD